ncbi:MAG: amidohydrolase family protein [Gemmatimonadota bacterium]
MIGESDAGWLLAHGRGRRLLQVRAGAVVLTLCLATVGGASAQNPEAFVAASTDLFTNLTLIDGRGGPPQPNSAILVWNGRIRAAGPRSSVQVAQGTRVVDLEGAFVVPGYIDAHAAPRDSATLAAMLAVGITGVREAMMPLDRFVARGRKSIAGGPLPTVFIGGPILEGPGGLGGLVIASPDAIDGVMDRLVGEYDARFVSVAGSVPPEWVRDIARVARRGGVPVWIEGRARGWLTSLRMGADIVAGLVSLDPDLLSEASRASYSATLTRSPAAALTEWLGLLDPHGPEVDVAISALLSRDAAVVPLLAATESPLRCVSAGEGCGGRSEAERNALLRNWPVALAFTRALYDEEVRLLVGSGLPSNPASAARFHREMELLVEAGVPPIDVLSMATRNGAIALNELHRRGTIEADKAADFVILAADPTVDIRNARQVRAIVLDGRGWVPLPEGGFQRIRFH